MGAVEVEESRPSLLISKEDQILSQKSDWYRGSSGW
jgi:hypothetical protein